MPEDLIELWVGHAPATVSDGYSKLKEYVESGASPPNRQAVGTNFLSLPLHPRLGVPKLL